MSKNQIVLVVSGQDAGATKVLRDVKSGLEDTGRAAERSKTPLYDMFSSVQGEILAATGVIVGFGVAAKKAFDFAEYGAKVTQTGRSFEGLMKSVGGSSDMLERLRKAAGGTISDMELMSSASTVLVGVQGEFGRSLADNIPRILEIAKAAEKANPALGDTAFMFQSLTTGLKRASPLLIDNTGLKIKLGEANATLAAQLGTTVEELTGEEQQLALLNATLEAGDRLIEQVGGSTASATDKFKKLGAELENVKNKAAEALAPFGEAVATGALEMLTGEMGRATDVLVDDYLREVARGITTQEEFSEAIKQNATAYEYLSSRGRIVADETGRIVVVSRDAAGATRLYTDEFLQMLNAIERANEIYPPVTQYGYQWVESLKAQSAATGEMGAATKGLDTTSKEYIQTQARLRDEYAQLADAHLSAAQKFTEGGEAMKALREQLATATGTEREAILSKITALEAETQAQLAMQAVAALEPELFGTGAEAAVRYEAAKRDLMLATGLVTQAGLAEQEALVILNQAYISGSIGPEQYAAALGRVKNAAADGVVKLGELVPAFASTGSAAADLAGKAGLASSELDAMADSAREARRQLNAIPRNIEVTIHYNEVGNAGGASGGEAGREYAAGTMNYPGGMGLVGEEGAELVVLPSGTRIYPASSPQTRQYRQALAAAAMGRPMSAGMAALAAAGGVSTPTAMPGGGGSTTTTINSPSVSVQANVADRIDVEDLAWRVAEVVGRRARGRR